MKTTKHLITNANHAVARIAFKTNEICPIYPITPATEMSELVEKWSSEKHSNIYNTIPSTFEMQSEAGVAGAMHGALTTGSLSTTFTASQGLLLMMPNMLKIAGELMPNVIHVATRSIATHALSIFGDHTDIMAVRSTGYAMLGGGTVQEAQDFALIAQSATLQSRIPFINFFDGFRTSHEINKIESISDDVIKSMIDVEDIKNHKKRALNPNNPTIKGTSQGPEIFFQSREAINKYYDDCPNIVQEIMNQFATLTNRQYKLFDFIGHENANQVIISMASSCSTIESTINELNSNGEKFGLIKVRLFRPFSKKHLIEALPKSVKSIAVIDRTKESGASAEPLYLDVLQSINDALQTNKINTIPKIIGGRYGLASKEFTPTMVKAIYENLKLEIPKNNFTVGINDDQTHLNLDCTNTYKLVSHNYEAIFYQDIADKETNSIEVLSNNLGNHKSTFIQLYSTTQYKKNNAFFATHLRIGKKPINAPYLISKAHFISCTDKQFINDNSIINKAKDNGIILVLTTLSTKKLWKSLNAVLQYQLLEKNINLLTVDTNEIKANIIDITESLSPIHMCFLALLNKNFTNYNSKNIREFIYKVDKEIDSNLDKNSNDFDTNNSKSLLGLLLKNKGNDIPVSLLPIDGTYKTNTSKHLENISAYDIPKWQPDICTQCGLCSLACPQGALRMKVFDKNIADESPNYFEYIDSNEFDLMKFTIQVNPGQCTSCLNCIDACESNALNMATKTQQNNSDSENWNFLKNLPEFERSKINTNKISQQQLQEPLFKYALGDSGCGESPYLKLLSQLFGERLLIANATGSSSIFGGSLFTPWSTNKKGQGPAWANSLFEDNAEFGLGFRYSLNQQRKEAENLLKGMTDVIDYKLIDDIINAKQNNEIDLLNQQNRIIRLIKELEKLNTKESKLLITKTDNFIDKSVWCVGGDGWAYDIGYGGLDHVFATGENVNILVLDNEVYDNTGGQISKSTPIGASQKFKNLGKKKQKKDLGWLAMTYDNVYVASVSIGANPEQALQAFNEAEAHNGPSIIIAYCHSKSHGIDMKNPKKYHKAAVASGQWLLYRNNPERLKNNLNPFQLDSKKPITKIEDYLKMEDRFSNIFESSNPELIKTIDDYQIRINKKYSKYFKLAIPY